MKKLLMIAAMTTTIFMAGEMRAQSSDIQVTSTKTIIAAKEPEDGFRAIPMNVVPAAITAAIERDLNGAKLKKAYINKMNDYKLIIQSDSSSETRTMYANAKGEWIKPSE